MKFVELTEANKPLAEYAMQLDDEAVVVVKNGKPIAVLSSAQGMDAESIALANNPKFVEIIAGSRARMEKEGGIPVAEVRRRLGLPRSRKRKKKAG